MTPPRKNHLRMSCSFRIAGEVHHSRVFSGSVCFQTSFALHFKLICCDKNVASIATQHSIQTTRKHPPSPQLRTSDTMARVRRRRGEQEGGACTFMDAPLTSKQSGYISSSKVSAQRTGLLKWPKAGMSLFIWQIYNTPLLPSWTIPIRSTVRHTPRCRPEKSKLVGDIGDEIKLSAEDDVFF